MPRSFSISATNPCHLYDVARSLNQRGLLDTYYSGYPQWKLRRSEGMTIRSFSARTLVVYGLLKTIPERYRLSNRTLFRWQDENFDRRVARELGNDSPFVAIPGQALESFRRARELGVKTILSHATGPLQTWIDLVREEFNRAGVPFSEHAPVDEATLKRHFLEYELTDLHWVPSQIVKKQMIDVGIDEEKIRVIPFGADPVIFRRESAEPKPQVVLFAGQLTWRKGLRLLDQVIPQLPSKIQIQFAGPALEESREWVAKWSGDSRVKFWGSLSAESLAAKMREARVLILPL
jgi:glycosyltransferase involved in cell wall biosynthesis